MEQRAMAIAIATVMVAAGLSVAPPAAAVSADCTEDYNITSTPKTRTLAANGSEAGLVEVSAPTDEKLNVTLETPNAEMEFGIFELVDDDCTRSTNVSDNCDQDVKLETNGGGDDSIECTLEAPLSGTRDFYVVFENPGSDPIDYTVHSSDI